MGISYWLKSFTVSSGYKLELNSNDFVILVGPNNSGKSCALRQFVKNDNKGPVITSVEFELAGSDDDFDHWRDHHLQQVQQNNQTQYGTFVYLEHDSNNRLFSSMSLPHTHVSGDFVNQNVRNIDHIHPLLVSIATTETRLKIVRPAPIFKVLSDVPSHPTQVIYQNDKLEKKLCSYFRKAFGLDIVLNRGAGAELPFHCGESPPLQNGENCISSSYLARLIQLPLLHEQGDGMRSFAGCLLYFLASPAMLHLIDEPEAFLHPPQARLMGHLLVSEQAQERQTIVATHSGDFLRGVLDADPKNLKIVRLTRQGDINFANCLDKDQISELLSDPVLRFSNTLDGVFHESVIVCEDDSDCRFYSAVLNAVTFTDEIQPPDVMFTACGGKHRMPMVVRALTGLGVPTGVIVDFDVLNNKKPLRDIVEGCGGDWALIEPLWKSVRSAIESKSPPLSLAQVRDQINTVLDKAEINGAVLTDEESEAIRRLTRATSPWQETKQSGIHSVPKGQPSLQAMDLLKQLRELGIFVVDCGEIEGFAQTIGRHGSKWVAEVLQKDVATDPELENARKFVRSFAQQMVKLIGNEKSPVALEAAEMARSVE